MRVKDAKEHDPAIDAYLRKQKGAPGDVARMLVALVRELVPGVQEKLRYGAAQFAVGGEVFCYVATQTAHTNLGFIHGAKMVDPTGRIEGTGKSLRHIKLRGVDDMS